MDAQIFQMDEHRNKAAIHALQVPFLDAVRAMNSAASFFVWYSGAMLSVHVAMLRAAVPENSRG